MIVGIAVTALASFSLGVIFGRYVINEADTIKKHVTEEVARLRSELARLR